VKKTLTTSLIAFGTLSLLSVPAFTEGERDPEGASSLAGALDRDHDGSILDNLGGI
jgi:hypothetical protein